MWLKKKVKKTVSTSRFCAKNICKISNYCFVVRIFHTQAVHKHYTLKHVPAHAENINQAFILVQFNIILWDMLLKFMYFRVQELFC